jgi:DNA-binding transcriptional LysR family regulator
MERIDDLPGLQAFERIVAELAQARDAMARQQREISGLLKITAPYSFGRRRLVPLLAQFSALHPQLRIQVELSDDVLDLIAGGFDLAIRSGTASAGIHRFPARAVGLFALCAAGARAGGCRRWGSC